MSEAALLQEHPENPSERAPSSGKRPPNAIACNGCDNWWTGLRAAHCSACHRTFTVVSAGLHAHGTRYCVDPATVGLVPVDKPWPGWAYPGSNLRFAAKAAT